MPSLVSKKVHKVKMSTSFFVVATIIDDDDDDDDDDLSVTHLRLDQTLIKVPAGLTRQGLIVPTAWSDMHNRKRYSYRPGFILFQEK